MGEVIEQHHKNKRGYEWTEVNLECSDTGRSLHLGGDGNVLDIDYCPFCGGKLDKKDNPQITTEDQS